MCNIGLFCLALSPLLDIVLYSRLDGIEQKHLSLTVCRRNSLLIIIRRVDMSAHFLQKKILMTYLLLSFVSLSRMMLYE
jgi:hypothetical protein